MTIQTYYAVCLGILTLTHLAGLVFIIFTLAQMRRSAEAVPPVNKVMITALATKAARVSGLLFIAIPPEMCVTLHGLLNHGLGHSRYETNIRVPESSPYRTVQFHWR